MIFPLKGTALAPMRALTQAPFWRLLNRYGAPNAYFSEFVRVHENYIIEKAWIEEALSSVEGRPLWVQLMGNNLSALEASVRVLEHFPIAGIDFNVGCPVPKIFKKQAGGGLLRDLPLLRSLLLGLRQVCTKPLSVKFRIGFDSDKDFESILKILLEAQVDLATLHARTVSDLYRGQARHVFTQKAVQSCPFPILANGDIHSLSAMENVLTSTQCHGLMIGRGALINPWIFKQWKQIQTKLSIQYPLFSDVFGYLEDLYHVFELSTKKEGSALGMLKRFTNYIGLAVDPRGNFLQAMRRSTTLEDFWNCCTSYLLQEPQKLFVGIPFPCLYAQPNKEEL